MESTYFYLALALIVATVIIAQSYLRRRHVRSYQVYRHLKTGNEYAVLWIGRFEHNGALCVIYAPVDELDCPTPWVRDYNEFHDGRFTETGHIFHPN